MNLKQPIASLRKSELKMEGTPSRPCSRTKKAASLKNKIKAYEKKHGKLTPTSGRGKRITKRTDELFKKNNNN